MKSDLQILVDTWKYYFSALDLTDYDTQMGNFIDRISAGNLTFNESDKKQLRQLIKVLSWECDMYEMKIMERIEATYQLHK